MKPWVSVVDGEVAMSPTLHTPNIQRLAKDRYGSYLISIMSSTQHHGPHQHSDPHKQHASR